MKRGALSAFLVIVVCLAITPLPAATSQANRAEKVAQSITKLQEVLQTVKGQIDTTMKSLTALSDGQGDLVAKYDDFAKDVKDTESMAKKAKSASEKMKGKREEYIKAHQDDEAAIQNAELKASMEARRAEMQPVIDQIGTSLTSAKEGFGPWMQDLNDLKLYLANSLNATGLAGAKPLIDKCSTAGEKVKADIDAGISGLTDLSGKIKPGGPTAK